ncbi:toxin biosynthesis protein [Cordyceps javanica]|uniref:Toxin biosynthesis protein n=1 Tax=Cordyceps javanica TaxID=43265 RepID=A0A545W3Y6_9HYPO|nr:toxin biosynthesis protein [Cordyceps javanica]TQW08656.1 toxin biosynthesis protein [Cordyceps javanica]
MASSVFDIKEHVIPGEHTREYARAKANSQEETLSIQVKQYTPKGNGAPRKGDLSIIGAHANGFPKELYEPLWEDLVKELATKGVRVGSIWIADCAWQGQSGLLNQDKLGDDPSWFDYSRDMLQMINHFRMPRPLVGIGHSFGACTIVKLSLFHPRLFSSLVLVDPVISTHKPEYAEAYMQPPAMSARRRDVWPSRDEAAAAFRKSPFYQAWDPRVFDRWVAYGLTRRGAPGSAEVTLTTTKHQEVFTFSRPSYHALTADGTALADRDLVPDMDLTHGVLAPVYRPEPGLVFEELRHLRPHVLWVFGGASYMSPKFMRDEKVSATGVGVGGSGGVAAGRVAHVVGEGWGHLIPLEAPGFVARVAADSAAETVKRWQAEERAYEAWTRKPLAEKSRIRQETLDVMTKVLAPKI